jgi:hypothetical protein
MLALTRSAAAWNSPAFQTTLVEEVQALGPHHPVLRPLLQAGLTQTSAVAKAPLGAQVLRSAETAGLIHVHLGIFYAGIIAGCNCADDPTPVDTITEHCELLLDIDPTTGRAWLTACADAGD